MEGHRSSLRKHVVPSSCLHSLRAQSQCLPIRLHLASCLHPPLHWSEPPSSHLLYYHGSLHLLWPTHLCAPLSCSHQAQREAAHVASTGKCFWQRLLENLRSFVFGGSIILGRLLHFLAHKITLSSLAKIRGEFRWNWGNLNVLRCIMACSPAGCLEHFRSSRNEA